MYIYIYIYNIDTHTHTHTYMCLLFSSVTMIIYLIYAAISALIINSYQVIIYLLPDTKNYLDKIDIFTWNTSS